MAAAAVKTAKKKSVTPKKALKLKLVPPKSKLKGTQLPLPIQDLVPAPKTYTRIINICRCGKNVAMYSGLLEEGFCSDKCYESAKTEVKGRAEARIKATAKGETYFEQGDIRFAVDPRDLAKVVGSKSTKESGCIARLMDSQIVTLAQANGLPVSPFVRELLEPVLVGHLQLIWYRDLEKHETDHLTTNQQARVANYLRRLSEWKAPAETGSSNGSRAPRAAGSAPRAAKTAASLTTGIELKKMPKESDLPKQAFVMMTILKEKGGKMSVAELQSAMVGKVVTKQSMSNIWGFYRAQLVSKGFITLG